MELRAFVEQTLVHIVDGVKAAQHQVVESGAIVNPKGLAEAGKRAGYLFDSDSGRQAQGIEFDVAVTTSESGEATGAVGIFVGPVQLGVKGKSGSSSSDVARIKFDVYVLLPTT